jgi:hypothetical protein
LSLTRKLFRHRGQNEWPLTLNPCGNRQTTTFRKLPTLPPQTAKNVNTTTSLIRGNIASRKDQCQCPAASMNDTTVT